MSDWNAVWKSIDCPFLIVKSYQPFSQSGKKSGYAFITNPRLGINVQILSRIIITMSTIFIAACGGGSPNEREAPTESLLVIGNSLATHAADASLGWNHESGMAASDAAHDFAHLTAAGRGIPLKAARNEASIERNPADPINTVDLTTPMGELMAAAVAGIDTHTAVVVELGDNVQDAQAADFAVNYGRLLDMVVAAKPQALVCTSRWWQVPDLDAMMKTACVAHGGRFVDIGDIYPTRADVIPPGENSGVAAHPHDPSMAIIASRILQALQPTSS